MLTHLGVVADHVRGRGLGSADVLQEPRGMSNLGNGPGVQWVVVLGCSRLVRGLPLIFKRFQCLT